ncbi:hypothetical protein DAT35_14550 [Vitiosangium sp. GDMCC 1.1324]|nr:hypothetical protein DAT35_14550 [Vitiosangium sp. GDMCC 1.1324]
MLLVPRVGLAAEDAPRTTTAAGSSSSDSGLPGTQERAPVRLGGDAGSWAREPERPSRGLRILAETGASLLTGLGGGFVGMLAGDGLCGSANIGRSGDFLPCLEATGVGLLAGAGLGFSLGTFWGGEVAGGDGRLLGALVGMGSGALVGILAGTAMSSIFLAGVVLGIPLSLIGSIVGYELTEQGTPPAAVSARPRLQPVLAVSSHGGLLGLGGTF